VFEKGVETVHNSYFHYLNELLKAMLALLNSPSILAQRFQSELDVKFALLSQRIVKDVDFAIKCLDKATMAYNEITFSRIVYHLMFTQAMAKYVSEGEAKALNEATVERIRQSELNLNCFMKLFI
jgi:hypothetical protein